jgi:HEAT repeat protein
LLTEAIGTSDLDQSLRTSATVALGNLGYSEAIPALRDVIASGQEHTPEAAQAVARIGIVAAERSKDDLATEQLGEAGKLLLQLLTDSSTEPTIRKEVAVGLAMMGPAGVEKLIDTIGEQSTPDDTKRWATATLGAIGRHASSQVIDQRRLSTDTEFRTWLAIALSCMTEDAKAQQTFATLPDEDKPPAEQLASVQDLAQAIRLLRK